MARDPFDGFAKRIVTNTRLGADELTEFVAALIEHGAKPQDIIDAATRIEGTRIQATPMSSQLSELLREGPWQP